MSQKRFLIEYELDYNRRKRNPGGGDSVDNGTAASSAVTASVKKKTLLSPILRAPSHDDPEHLDWQTSRQIKTWKEAAQQSSAHLQDVIGKLNGERPSSPSKTSENKSGRPKSPYVKHSRPQTANAGTESFARAVNGMTKDIEKMKKMDYQPVHHPTWDDRFVFGKSLSPLNRPATAAVHLRHKKFVQKMAKYKKPRKQMNVLSKSAPTLRLRASSPSKMENPSSGDELRDTTPVKSRDHSRASSPEHFDSPAPEDPVDPRVLQAVEDVWQQLVAALHKSGQSIHYQEMFEVAILRDPPDILIAVVGYIALLMGLKPAWKTIKTTLLREFNIFQNFVREVS